MKMIIRDNFSNKDFECDFDTVAEAIEFYCYELGTSPDGLEVISVEEAQEAEQPKTVKTYSIHEDNMDDLEKKLNRIANKCRKYGCEFSYRKVGEEYRELKDSYGDKYFARFILVEADGKTIVNGWSFSATVEHTAKGNIIHSYDGTEIPEKYLNSVPVCEHCKARRQRNDTYIVRNVASGELKQVGKSCLKDFTSGLSAEGVTAYTSLFTALIEGEAVDARSGQRSYVLAAELLKYAAETVRLFGYVKSGEYRSTANRTTDYYAADNGGGWLPRSVRDELRSEMAAYGFNANSDENKQTVADALAWIAEQDAAGNYMHNLKTVCSLEYVTARNIGLLVSLIPTCSRAADKAVEDAKKEANKATSNYVGEVGQRITVNLDSVNCLTSWDSAYGTTWLYKLTDKDGNAYVWKTGSYISEWPETLRGTIKKHVEYKGEKQTELSRCKVLEVKSPAKQTAKPSCSVDDALDQFLAACS